MFVFVVGMLVIALVNVDPPRVTVCPELIDRVIDLVMVVVLVIVRSVELEEGDDTTDDAPLKSPIPS